MKNIDFCFIYFNGRLNKLHDKVSRPQEFYYGYQFVSSKGYSTKILEFGNTKKSFFLIDKFFWVLQYSILRIFKFQYDFTGIIRPKNWSILKKSKNIVISNNRIAHSLLPFLAYSKLMKRKQNIIVIAMGLFNSSSDNSLILKIHHTLHNLMIKSIDRLIFLGEPEYKLALEKFSKYKNKIEFIPFGIDTNFWSRQYVENVSEDYILFIGNDSNRDFKFLKQLVMEIKDKEFIIVSENPIFKNFKNKNVKVLNGSWNKNTFEDSEIRKLYENAKVTIVPLKNSIQPSGQSVTLQSMSMGTPVIITKTSGFWKLDDYEHLENIIFTNTNNTNEWIEAIDLIYKNNDVSSKISQNSRRLILEKYNLIIFNKKLLNFKV